MHAIVKLHKRREESVSDLGFLPLWVPLISIDSLRYSSYDEARHCLDVQGCWVPFSADPQAIFWYCKNHPDFVAIIQNLGP